MRGQASSFTLGRPQSPTTGTQLAFTPHCPPPTPNSTSQLKQDRMQGLAGAMLQHPILSWALTSVLLLGGV